jgi:membrane protein insertase Oxa1/YidC/SpoIIIJ
MFSSEVKPEAADEADIFSSVNEYQAIGEDDIDFLDTVTGEEVPDVEPIMNSSQMLPWADSNDTLNSFISMMPKDAGNLVRGDSTYGPWEYICWMDQGVYDLWLYSSDEWSLGLGLGLMASTFCVRLAFVPLVIYQQASGMKMKLMQPDQEEMQAAVKRYSQ